MSAQRRQDGSQTTSRGVFITFEGGEGVGKSTQIQLLAERLRLLGREVVVSREPGGTPGAEAVRHVILSAGMGEPFGPVMEATLFAAARNDHVEQVIRPAVHRGAVVLVDRFMDSTRVYQGVSGNLPVDLIASLERVAIAGMVPDLTIVLDLDPAEGMARAGARRGQAEAADRFEKEQLAIHEARREAFIILAESEPHRIKLVDARADSETVASRVWKTVRGLFPMKADETVQATSSTADAVS